MNFTAVSGRVVPIAGAGAPIVRAVADAIIIIMKIMFIVFIVVSIGDYHGFESP
jgi:hypothetical protein